RRGALRHQLYDSLLVSESKGIEYSWNWNSIFYLFFTRINSSQTQHCVLFVEVEKFLLNFASHLFSVSFVSLCIFYFSLFFFFSFFSLCLSSPSFLFFCLFPYCISLSLSLYPYLLLSHFYLFFSPSFSQTRSISFFFLALFRSYFLSLSSHSFSFSLSISLFS